MRLITKEERTFFHAKTETDPDVKFRKLKTAIVWFGGNKTQAATALGVSDCTIYEWLKVFGVDKGCVCKQEK